MTRRVTCPPARESPGPTPPVRTYVVFRYAGPPVFGRPPDGEVELTPLGTVEARTRAEARARAAARWPGVPSRGLKLRTARAAGAGALAIALALDAGPDQAGR